LRRGPALGGRLALCCWCAPSDNAWITAPLPAVRDLLPGDFALPAVGAGTVRTRRPEPYPRDPDAFGWCDVVIARHAHMMRLGATPEDAARGSLVIGPIARSVARFPDATHAEILARLVPALALFATPHGS
jgi:hypothetical protein